MKIAVVGMRETMIHALILHDLHEATRVLMIDDITSTETRLAENLRTAETSLMLNLADVAANQRRAEDDLECEVERKKRAARSGWGSGPGSWKRTR